MVSDVTITGAQQGQQSTAQAQEQFSEDYLEFLNLLTVQLQNQDPLDPADTNQLTDQIVQFSQVEQQINTNSKLDDLVALQIGDSFAAAQNYVGLEASYISSEIPFDGSSPTTITYALDAAATSAKINVRNEAGSVVFSTEANRTIGAHDFTWNGQLTNGGTAPAGTYTVTVDALDSEGQSINSTTVVRGLIRGVETQNGQIFMLVGERAVSVSNILNTNAPGSSAFNSGAFTAALDYIGLDITYQNGVANFDGSEPVKIEYDLSSDAERGQFLVFNESGEVIYSEEIEREGVGFEQETVIDEETGIGTQVQGDPIFGIKEGSRVFEWNGRLNDNTIAPAGNYTFAFDMIGFSDNRIPVSTEATSRVTGVETQGSLIYLSVEEGRVALSNVTSISVPEEPETTEGETPETPTEDETTT